MCADLFKMLEFKTGLAGWGRYNLQTIICNFITCMHTADPSGYSPAELEQLKADALNDIPVITGSTNYTIFADLLGRTWLQVLKSF
jgi:hypothetical protein